MRIEGHFSWSRPSWNAVWGAFLVLSLVLFSGCAARRACSIDPMLVGSVERLRGFDFVNPVACRIEKPDEIRAFLLDSLYRKNPPAKIRYEGTAYKLVGLIPLDYDYLAGIVDAYSSTIAGYYSPELSRYVMTPNIDAIVREQTMVHELTHALQDQYFNISTMLDGELTNDVLMARTALLEGDATAVMLRHGAELNCDKLNDRETFKILVDRIIAYPFSPIPQALRMVKEFPYLYGLNFYCALHEKHGYDGVNAALKDPPRSTEEVMHPAKYLAGGERFDVFADFVIPTEVAQTKSEYVFEDSLGEFAIFALLSNYVNFGPAFKAANNWNGDLMRLYDGEEGMVLVWNTAWDTVEDAERFDTWIVRAYEARFPGVKAQSGAGASRFAVPGFGNVIIERQGLRVAVAVSTTNRTTTGAGSG